MAKDTVVGAKVGIAVDEQAISETFAALRSAAAKLPASVQREILQSARSVDKKKTTAALMGMTEDELGHEMAEWARRGAEKAEREMQAAAEKFGAAFRASAVGMSGRAGTTTPAGGWMNMSLLSTNPQGPQKTGASAEQTAAALRMMGLPSAAEQEKLHQEIQRNVDQILLRDRHMRNRVALKMDQEAVRAQQRAESERQARGERRGQFVSGAMMGTGLFAVGEGGKLLSTLGLGNTPIGSAYAGGAAGLGAGMSIGMAGGPAGVAMGGLVGAVGGGLVGMYTGVVKMTMDLLYEGVSKAMGVIEQGAREIIKLGMEYERILTKFEVLTGSKEMGSRIYGGIEKMATTTPYTAGKISSNVEMLLGYGVKPEQSLIAARRLGDIGAGDPVRYERLALAFGQVVSQGRLMGQELRQFSEAGVGAADFAETYGKSVFQLKKDMEAGIVPAQIMMDTIKRLTEEGGRFAGMNERVSKTVEGRWTALVGTAEMVGRRIGEGLFQKFDVAGKLDVGVGGLQGLIDPKSIDEIVDKITNLGKGLHDAIVPTLDYAYTVGVNLMEAVFGDQAKGGLITWQQIGELLKSTFEDVLDLVITTAEVTKAIIIPLGRIMNAFNDLGPGFDKLLDKLENSTFLEDLRKAQQAANQPGGGLKPGWWRPSRAMGQNKEFDYWDDLIKKGGYVPVQGENYLTGPHARDFPQFRNDYGIPEWKKDKRTWTREEWNKWGNPGVNFERARAVEGMAEWMRDRAGLVGPRVPITDQIAGMNIPGLGNALAPIVGIGKMAAGLFGLGKPGEDRNINLTADAEVQKMFDELTKAMKEGISPWEKFATSMDTIAKGKDTRGGMGLDFMGPVIPGKNDLLTKEMADRERYEAFMKLKGATHLHPLTLPATVGQDTQEAIKIINEATRDAARGDSDKLSQAEMNAIIKQAGKDQEDISANIKIVREYFDKNPPVLKPQGIK